MENRKGLSIWQKIIANTFDSKDNTIRGSFISQLLTLFMMIIIIAGILDDKIMDRASKLSEIILGFYFTSLGIWKVGKFIKKE